ncbi:MAG: nucleoside-triphosphatase [Candidatus Bathyarchaeota archaeon]|nr:MAG: nucleoside-triphosphatase [Candidatus Bathyarchaeota archaeon]
MGLRGKFFLSGRPGSGKSTAFMRCVEKLRSLDLEVGGIATPEIRSLGRRVGFSVVDLSTGLRALMAGIDISSGFRVGRYGVDLPGFESVALPALDHAEEACDVICIDEIGRMELFSRSFKARVGRLLRGPKPMVCVLHRSYTGTYGGYGVVFQVSPENRGRLPEIVVSSVEGYLSGDP